MTFSISAKIQDGCQKWQQSNFCEMSPLHSADTLRVKYFKSRTISKIMHFCVLRRNSRWPTKVAGERFLLKVASRLFIYPTGQKFRQNHSISDRFQDKYFYILRRNSRWPPKGGRKFRRNPCILHG